MFLNAPNTLAAVTATTAAQAVTALQDPSYTALSITATDAGIYWGGLGVTAATGQPLAAGQTMTVATMTPHLFYVITASGTANVRVTAFTGHGS